MNNSLKIIFVATGLLASLSLSNVKADELNENSTNEAKALFDWSAANNRVRGIGFHEQDVLASDASVLLPFSMAQIIKEVRIDIGLVKEEFIELCLTEIESVELVDEKGKKTAMEPLFEDNNRIWNTVDDSIVRRATHLKIRFAKAADPELVCRVSLFGPNQGPTE